MVTYLHLCSLGWALRELCTCSRVMQARGVVPSLVCPL